MMFTFVEASSCIMDSAVESDGIGEDAVGELILLEVMPAFFDIIQL